MIDDKILEAALFSVNEKAVEARKIMDMYKNEDIEKYNFYKGQYQAYYEIYTMLSNLQ